MRRIYFAAFLTAAFCSVCYGDLRITFIKKPLGLGKADFYVEDVIDSRPGNGSIGFAKTGPFKKETEVFLKGGFRKALLDYLRVSFPKRANKTPVVLNVLEFNVSETMDLLNEKSEAKATIEFYTKKQGKLIKLFRKDSYVKRISRIDCTRFHEPNIRYLLNNTFKAFIDSAPNLACEEEDLQCALTKEDIVAISRSELSVTKVRQMAKLDEPYFMQNWTGIVNTQVYYDVSRKGFWYNFFYEIPLVKRSGYNNSMSYSLGSYSTNNSDTDIIYQDGTRRSGKISVDAVPAMICFYHRVKSGFFKGKWGLGLAAYNVKGSIDMAPYDGVYKVDTTAANIVIPYEEVIYTSPGNKDIFLSVNLSVHVPVTPVRFERENWRIETHGFAGTFVGISIGRYWK